MTQQTQTIEIRNLNPMKSEKNKNLMAICDVIVNRVLIRAVKLLERNDGKGRFIGYPSKKSKRKKSDGTGYEVLAMPLDKSVQAEIHTAIEAAYEAKVKQAPASQPENTHATA